MRVALCQINPTVGDLRGNRALIVDAARRAAEQDARLAVFPELAVCGYPPRDLLERGRFVTDGLEALEHIAREVPASLVVVVGCVSRAPSGAERPLHNAAAVLRGGAVERMIPKRLLPTYDVFDEDRYFEPGGSSTPIDVDGTSVGVTVCEDVWNDTGSALAGRRYQLNPLDDLEAAGAELIVNLSASPFTLTKHSARPHMLSEIAASHRRPLVFVNQVGGNDDLLFDGDSALYGPDGATWARLACFGEDMAVVELGPDGPVREQPASPEAAALDALTSGVRDYARKCGFEDVVVGLSGGIDSALTASIAARALGPEHVLGVSMPTRYTSRESLDDAEGLATALGISHRSIPIDPVYQSYLDHLGPHLEALGPSGPNDVTFENVQARIRGQVLMAISNRLGTLLLTTGNKSEIAVGYCTLYGDMAGGLAVISDVPKTFVYRIAREVNRRAGRAEIPDNTLRKPPSAELREDQKDSDALPAYDVLDPILERYVEDGASVDAILAEGHDPALVERVVQLVLGNEYKRRQMPPGLVLTRKAFGPGRRYPIAHRYRH